MLVICIHCIVKNNTMVKVFCNTKLKLLEVKPQIRSPKSKEIRKLNVAVGFFGLCLIDSLSRRAVLNMIHLRMQKAQFAGRFRIISI